MESYALLIAATLNAGTVLALAALGLLINEKAGVVNLGAEGIMLCAAIAGFAAVVHTGSDWLGFAAGMASGALLAGLMGLLVIWLGTNQYATGLALSLFGAGFSAFAGIHYVQEKLPERAQFSIPLLGDLPLVGPALFRQHPLVYGAMALALGLIWFLYRTRAGLVLRSVGESPESAHALGYPVRRIRLAPRLTSHVRHRAKYLDVPVPEGQAFTFSSDRGGPAGPRARTLKEFARALLRSSPEVLEGHMRRGDFSRWIAGVFGDHPLASHMRRLEERHRMDHILDLNEALVQLIRERYEVGDGR